MKKIFVEIPWGDVNGLTRFVFPGNPSESLVCENPMRYPLDTSLVAKEIRVSPILSDGSLPDAVGYDYARVEIVFEDVSVVEPI